MDPRERESHDNEKDGREAPVSHQTCPGRVTLREENDAPRVGFERVVPYRGDQERR